jgi:hypothetical protein
LYVVDPDEQEPDERGELVDTYGRLERYTADRERGRLVADLDSRTILIGEVPGDAFPICHSSHMIGTLRFGADGTLFAGAGDGAHFDGIDVGGRDAPCFDPNQNPGFDPDAFDIGALRSIHPDSLSGKILRLDPLTGLGVPSNPLFDAQDPGSARSMTWASGLRNPYRFTVRPNGSADPDEGNPGSLYISDVGWGDLGGDRRRPRGWRELRLALLRGRSHPRRLPGPLQRGLPDVLRRHQPVRP